MRLITHQRSGQSTAEYAVVIAIVLGAVVGMQSYMKRGLQAKLKAATEKFTNVPGNADFPFTKKTGQYEPYYSETNVQVDSVTDSKIEETQQGTATSYGVTRTGTIRDVKRGDAGGKAAQIEHGSGNKNDDSAWQ